MWKVLKYSCETWTMNAESKKELNAFEMWCYRRLLKILWTDFVTNATVLEKINKERNIVEDIKNRKMKYIAHKIRENGVGPIHVGSTGKNSRQTHQGREKSGVDNNKLAQ